MSLKGFLRGDWIWERMVTEENKKPVVTAKWMPTAQMSSVFKMIDVKYAKYLIICYYQSSI